MTTTLTPQLRAGRREWAGLAVLMIPVLLISIDNPVLGFAIPAISTGLHPTGTQLLWIVDIYALMLAGLLVAMGSLGDRVGRRKLLIIGSVGFGAASLLAAFSTSAEMLILARALLGIDTADGAAYGGLPAVLPYIHGSASSVRPAGVITSALPWMYGSTAGRPP